MDTAYKSFGGYGQSPLSNNPNWIMQQHQRLPPAAGGSPLPAFVPNTQLSSQSNHSSMPFTLFTACILAFIMYTMMKVLPARFGDSRPKCIGRDWSSNSKCRTRAPITDLRYDKRRLARMSRDERARQLILHHGSKNVSRAMKFLIGELEKQKRLLIAESNLSGNADIDCTCSCHPKG